MSAASPGVPCKDETPNALIVEGKDDCHCIYQIVVRSDLAPFGIWEGGSDRGALERFGGLLSASTRPKTLGIVLDSDSSDGATDSVSRHWTQIQDRLRDWPYAVPPLPHSEGTIIEGNESFPRIGVWLMPNNQAAGMFDLSTPAANAFVTWLRSYSSQSCKDESCRRFAGR